MPKHGVHLPDKPWYVPETFESLRGSFNRFLRVEGKADRTLVLYGQSITYFSQWLLEQGLPADLSSLTRDNVLGWLDSVRARGLTTGTVRTRWRGLRRFVNWVVAEDIITKDPLAGIVVDKPEPPPVPVFTDEELTALVGACRGKSFNDLRDAAVIRLLIDCIFFLGYRCPGHRLRPGVYTGRCPRLPSPDVSPAPWRHAPDDRSCYRAMGGRAKSNNR
jgi:integrase